MNTCCKILYKEIAYEAYIKSKRDSFMMQKKKKKKHVINRALMHFQMLNTNLNCI